jgi:lysozyme
MKEFNPDIRPPEDFIPPRRNILIEAVNVVREALLDLVAGIDLSHWRPDVPIKTAKQQGVRFVITKATQGTNFYDDLYEHYRDETKGKGLAFGAFHYWDAKSKPGDQARYFYDHVRDDIDLLPILDVEKYYNEGVLSQAAAAQHIYDTLMAIQEFFGRPAMIYTNYNSWNVLTGNSPIIAGFALWVASWGGSQPTMPVGANEWVIWQYTNNYQIEGYPKGVDGNRFNGNEAAFEEYLRSINNGEPPPPEHDHADIYERLEALEASVDNLETEAPYVRADIYELQKATGKLWEIFKGIADLINSYRV